MKRWSFFMLFIALLAFAFTSCNDDEPRTDNSNSNIVIGQVENGEQLDIDSVYAVFYYYSEHGSSEEERVVLGASAYQNGLFGIGLIETFNPFYMDGLDYLLKKGISISNPQAKMLNGSPQFNAYKNGAYVGEFKIKQVATDDHEAKFVFTDRAFTLNGSYAENGVTVVFNNATFAKGWNVVYYQADTQNKIAYCNINETDGLKWFFFSNANRQ